MLLLLVSDSGEENDDVALKYRRALLRRQDFQQRQTIRGTPLDCARVHVQFEEKIQIENASYLQPAPSRSTTGGANL